MFFDAEEMCTGSTFVVIVLNDRQGCFEGKIRDERQFEVLIQRFSFVLKVIVCQMMR